MKPLSARWKQFAQSLHLHQDTIDIIDADNSKCELCMSETLDHWLRRDFDYTQYGTPSWETVCIAVKEGGGDTALAEIIAREHSLPAGVASSKIYVSSEKNYTLLNKLYELQEEFAEALRETKKIL